MTSLTSLSRNAESDEWMAEEGETTKASVVSLQIRTSSNNSHPFSSSSEGSSGTSNGPRLADGMETERVLVGLEMDGWTRSILGRSRAVTILCVVLSIRAQRRSYCHEAIPRSVSSTLERVFSGERKGAGTHFEPERGVLPLFDVGQPSTALRPHQIGRQVSSQERDE